jgi:hypothetical protein
MLELDTIIMDYLKPFPTITREDLEYLTKYCQNQTIRLKIIKQKLYQYGSYRDVRVDSIVWLLQETLQDHVIGDCEFVLFYDDSINDHNVDMVKGKPMIVATSAADHSFILYPDFTFHIFPDYDIKDHESYCNELVDSIPFHKKIPKLVFRGDMHPHTRPYRTQYIRTDLYYDCQHYDIVYPTGKSFLSRKEKNNYKYYLHLNGRHDNAYSSALKYGLCNSVVFYSAPTMYREFWQHPSIFKEGIHYIHTRSPEELDYKLNYYLSNEKEADQIAANALTFFKKFLWKKTTIKYYIQKLLNEYSKRMTYQPTLDQHDQLLSKV